MRADCVTCLGRQKFVQNSNLNPEALETTRMIIFNRILKIGSDDLNWIKLSQNVVQWQALHNRTIDSRPQMGKSSIDSVT
jgi:hypothetical protein